MVAPFAALETRLNRAVFSRLANADAYLDWAPVTGIFDNGYALGNVGPYGMASSSPTFTLDSAQVPSDVVGKTLAVGEDTATTAQVRYTIAAHQPDGTGISILLLEAA